MTKKFNGSTVNFAGNISGLRGISVSKKAAKIDVTASADTDKTYEAGIPDTEVKLDLVGSTTIDPGDNGALTIAWADGTNSGTLTSAVVIDVEPAKGSMDGEMTSTVTFVPKGA